jgi:hypothetical protein
MDVAFIQHAENDVDDHQRCADQRRRAGEGTLERLGVALEGGNDRAREADVLCCPVGGGPWPDPEATPAGWDRLPMYSCRPGRSVGTMLLTHSGPRAPQRVAKGL